MEDMMAIPVSMELPESFEHVDLSHIPKISNNLVNRYQKNQAAKQSGDAQANSNYALAQAIERLAEAIENSGKRQFFETAPEANQGSVPQSTSETRNSAEAGRAEYYEEEVPVLNGLQESDEQPEYEEDSGRVGPLGAPVLVRREAAAEAHRYKREMQARLDHRPGETKGPLALWVERHPYLMMITGLGLLLALVVITTIFMEGWLTGESSAPQGQGAVMALEGWSEDPDFRHAEREARGFLNATTLNSAKPYIFKAEEKEEILEAYYAPLPDPGNYTLELSGRKKLGQRSVYFYQVTSGPDVLPLVVLQEGENFKVHWEFTAGVGDMSWETFVEEKPSEAVLMRALLRPDGAHDAGHPATDWTSWAVEDWKGDYPVRLFTRNNSPEDRRLKSAFKEFGVRRHKQDWVMAQVVIQFQATAHDPNHGIFQSAQVMEVPLASWLPEEFELANTFYSDAERFDGEVKPVRGLMEGL